MPMQNSKAPQDLRSVTIDSTPVAIADVVAVARGRAGLQLSAQPAFQQAIARGAAFLDRLLAEDGIIYGVTTGYGDSCTVQVPADLVHELPRHLYTYHGCGLGQYFDAEQTRAIMTVRLVSLSKGYSGVSVDLLTQIEQLIRHDILPLIPSEGSVGASGDLTPLSYLAAALCGEREVLYHDRPMTAAEALQLAGLQPVRLRPKEGLAIMNGTAVMTALACLAVDRAAYLVRLCTRITAMAAQALDGNPQHFDATLFSVKPHAGMQQVAAWLRQDFPAGEVERNGKRLQDRYSIRCAPHVIGVLADALPLFESMIGNELNSANDNPIIDAEAEHVLHGGHFYGGHIAFAMDSMKNTVANLADLMDRQMALLVDARYNHDLPANLSGAQGPRASINHGLKALQISASAWTAEALKLTMPASVFSRSTECHNQDKVSMGTIAARDCLRVLELTEQVAAALLITVRQGLTLRQRLQQDMVLQPAMQTMFDALCADVAEVVEDRRLEPDLRQLLVRIRTQHWRLYAEQ